MSCLIQSTWVPASLTTAPVSFTPARIDCFTARNNDTVERLLTVHIVPNGGGADDSTIVLTIPVQSGQSYLCGELVGHDLDLGDTIQWLASVANVISVRASGRSLL